MKTFDEMLADSAELFLVDDFAPESITYKSQASGTNLKALATLAMLTGLPAALAIIGVGLGRWDIATRTLTALVNRQPPETLDEVPQGHAPLLTINVKNDSDDGISSDEINLGKDLVTIAVRLGETAQDRRITKILSQDAGMMKLEIR